MIFYICGALMCYVVEKIKNKLVWKAVHSSVKLIQYHKGWHTANDTYFNQLLEWVIL
jgi:hypothetical protein